MFGFGLLSGLTILPLIGSALILILKNDDAGARNARWTAMWTTLITFLLSLYAWSQFDISKAGFQLVEKKAWIGEAIVYQMGIDGISMPFVLLTTFLMPFCILASWNSIRFRVKEYMAAFLVLETMMIGVFTSLDLVLFYVFFEAGLIPMFLIIGIWGGRAPHLCELQVLPLHLAWLGADVAGDPGNSLCRADDGRHQAARLQISAADADLALARILCVIRGQDADVAGPYLAAGRAR